MFLLDVNALIALGDPAHEHHDRMLAAWEACQRTGWATCPITENAFVRILSHTNYPADPVDAETARLLLGRLTGLPGHQFWADDWSITQRNPVLHVARSGQVTDLYLLGLAVRRKSKLLTFDQVIDAASVRGGPEAVYVPS